MAITFRMDEMGGPRWGWYSLTSWNSINQRRAEATQYYQDRPRETAEESVPFANAPALSSNHIFPILLQLSDTC